MKYKLIIKEKIVSCYIRPCHNCRGERKVHFSRYANMCIDCHRRDFKRSQYVLSQFNNLDSDQIIKGIKDGTIKKNNVLKRPEKIKPKYLKEEMEPEWD